MGMTSLARNKKLGPSPLKRPQPFRSRPLAIMVQSRAESSGATVKLRLFRFPAQTLESYLETALVSSNPPPPPSVQ